MGRFIHALCLFVVAVPLLFDIPAGVGAALDAASGDADVKSVADSTNAFAIDLYQQLAQSPGNFCFSPYSIETAMAMTYAGARGQTAEQMRKVLHLSLPDERVHAAFAALSASIAMPTDRPETILSPALVVANSLWGQTGYPYNPDFIHLIRQDYGAEMRPVDFEANPQQARQEINQWVAGKTNNKIHDLIAPDLLNRSVRFVLVNAIYLKAACSAPFYEKNTAQRPFHIDATKDIAVPTMNGGDFNRGMENDDLQALQLGYAQSQLAMVFLLPRKPDGLASLEKQLTMQHLQQWIGALGSCFVRDAYLPKFKINASFALSDDLAQLGMADAFAPSANFGGIANTQPLKLSSVVHQSFLRIDEKGTEAAAATAVGGGAFGTSGHAISFVADHPFLFIIRDSGTGAILFMGRIVIPQG